MVRRGYASPEGTRQYQQYMEDLYDLGAGHWRSTQAEAGQLGEGDGGRERARNTGPWQRLGS